MVLSPRTILWINRNLRYILGGFAVVLLLLGYFLLLAPSLKKIFGEELATIKTLEAERTAEQAKLESVQRFVDRYQSVSRDEIARAERILPKEDQVPLLYAQIPGLVTAVGLKLDSMSVQKGAGVPIAAQAPFVNGSTRRLSVAGKTLGSVDVSLAISGGSTYEDLQRFLDAVENNLRVFDIASITFPTVLPEQEGKPVEIANYAVTLRTYYFSN